MADKVVTDRSAQSGALGGDVQRRYAEVRPGEYAPEVKIVPPTNPLQVSTAAPVAANILNGRQAFTATTAATTLVTVPAGRTWVGRIGASVACTTGPTATTAGQASAVFSVAGAGATPTGNQFAVDAMTAGNQATGGPGTANSNFGQALLTVIAPAGNTVTIQVTTTVTGTGGRIDAHASGELLPVAA